VRKYEQVIDGRGFAIRSRQKWRLACCDCGLVHDVVVVSGKGGWLGVAMRRNKRSTAFRRAKVPRRLASSGKPMCGKP